MIQPRPYILINSIQNYSWGTKNENAFIPGLLGLKYEPNIPYAELWIGAHTKASSTVLIDNENYKLIDLINKYPTEILGERVVNKFGSNLPYLLKVLSSDQALSIQTHPNKDEAIELHRKDPINYPDENHKPEIAIAIDTLYAIAGFKPTTEIKANLLEYPQLAELVSTELYKELIDCNDQDILTDMLKNAYANMMRESNDANKVEKVIQLLMKQIASKNILSEAEAQLVHQYKIYGNDIGLISFFFFNLIELKEGESIYTGAGTPHAYLKGNIVECMANSDNVVRAGLTPKFKDVESLLKIIKYDFEKYKIDSKPIDESIYTYETAAEEFRVTLFDKSNGDKINISTRNEIRTFLLIDGEIVLNWKDGNSVYSMRVKKGNSFIIPALLPTFTIECIGKCKLYMVEIP